MRPGGHRGERFDGLANVKGWREQYPTDVQFEVRRISGSGDVWLRELTVRYGGGPPMLVIAGPEFGGHQDLTERTYVTELWEAPAWRAPSRSAATAN
jgi:hypothetical protein